MEKYRNPDGTYNGVAMFAELTGLAPEEIRWTADRLYHLMHVEGKTKEEAKVIVEEESRSSPWFKNSDGALKEAGE